MGQLDTSYAAPKEAAPQDQAQQANAAAQPKPEPTPVITDYASI